VDGAPAEEQVFLIHGVMVAGSGAPSAVFSQRGARMHHNDVHESGRPAGGESTELS
jgi:hypothetical protein